ncbi:hypothetical protein F2Q69_00012373 [Brassica cretica]|uniref:Uncharacterized protein n=1 Tax=Brassica cretica TaxID=69181 RepID=A0A8S9QP33_BRACR|nr:hypothetical protein F2Q69_00012373 [Brassica cretica]
MRAGHGSRVVLPASYSLLQLRARGYVVRRNINVDGVIGCCGKATQSVGGYCGQGCCGKRLRNCDKVRGFAGNG